MKRQLINFAKLAVSLAIVIYLVADVQANHQEGFSRLLSDPKDWRLLAAAWLTLVTGVLLTFVRWYFLVRALDLPFRLRDAFRLGFLGYLLNFVSLGSVGGDLFKAVFIAREHPERKTAAVTTILVDRFTGLVGLLLIGSTAVLSNDLTGYSTKIQQLGTATLLCTALMLAALTAIMFRFASEGPHVDWLCSLKWGGAFFHRVFEAARTYRRRRGVLLLAVGITVVAQSLSVLGFYQIALGLPDAAPSLPVHFFIIPLGMISASIPLPMGALGAFEVAMNYLYAQVAPPNASDVQGLLVAITYRVMSISIALMGVIFYVGRRREVEAAIHDTEEEEIAAAE